MAACGEANEISVIVKWSGKEYSIENISLSETVRYLKDVIKDKTGVLPERQKLLGLKYKGEITDFKLPHHACLCLRGSPEKK